MYQNFQTAKMRSPFSGAAANMEPRDHSNGASPKSHTSRGNLLLKVMLFFVGICFADSVFAQSTIYLFYTCPKSGIKYGLISPIDIKINNEEAFTIPGRTKKTVKLHYEGKIIMSFKGENVNRIANPPITWQVSDEIQLTLSKNSVHYVKINGARMDVIKFEELTEADGIELQIDKNYQSTPDYVEQSSTNPSDTGKRGKTPQKEPAETPKTEVTK